MKINSQIVNFPPKIDAHKESTIQRESETDIDTINLTALLVLLRLDWKEVA